MQELKSNSHKSKNSLDQPKEDKKVESIITGTAKRRKKSEVKKFTDVFISDDVNNVKNYIIMDVIVPAVKDVIEDIIVNGIRIILRGDDARYSKDRRNSSRVSYHNTSHNRSNNRYESSNNSPKNGYSYDDIVLDNRVEADDVLNRMYELISTYGVVSVADLYDLVGITGVFTDNKYGWSDLRSASVVRVRDGYLLKLPKALIIT